MINPRIDARKLSSILLAYYRVNSDSFYFNIGSHFSSSLAIAKLNTNCA
jgi:hypothetical protein